MTTLAALFLDTDTDADARVRFRSGVMFVTSGAQGVLVEGVRPGRDPVRAVIGATDAVDVLDALWAWRSIELPAMDGVTGVRRLRFHPRPDGVEVSIRSRTTTRGRWLVHADRVPELGDALCRALITARSTTATAAVGTAPGGHPAAVQSPDTDTENGVAAGVGAGGAAVGLRIVPGGRR
ncbi:hypothetical protein FHR81_005586 [Actinoalloteichus hoggarensis]|uniref:Uncharacterized protein n=1 Tax=Actinoalloteichus hoggarensis TaxID=1470176 RepID=A0A221W8F0_9PSEU|nr:hypothetical protein [Actinoalloteichus hoggarensis]ASO21951.1 hypothetical protein AHOG_21675 [Actinoalloteichus hoggarensis]MBB5924501.1 hypothetical protein [Actinoalloteichus hoggarensis]